MPHVTGIIQYLSFCDWLISVNIVSSGCIHVVATQCLSFLRLNMLHCTCIPLCCSYILATMNNAAVYMIIQIFLWEPASNSFVTCPGVELLNHMVNITFNFSRNCHVLFQSGPTILHSHQQSMRVLVSPHPHQYLLLSVLSTMAILLLLLSHFSRVRLWAPS